MSATTCPTCRIERCEKSATAPRAMCWRHYQRWRRNGDPNIGVESNRELPTEDRFYLQTEPEPNTGCWIWNGAISTGGYGIFGLDHRSVKAHRFAYELLRGPIPAGLVIDHLCRNTWCVNPYHLEPVTMRTNTLRGRGPSANNHQKTHCFRGHELNAVNTYNRRDASRVCRICHNQLYQNR